MQSRRNFVAGILGGSVAAVVARAGWSGPLISSAEAASGETDNSADATSMRGVAQSTAECIRTGEACVAHCMRELNGGNTSMAKCNTKVHEMLAVTRTMLTLASMNSPLAKKLAVICADACKACADACGEHKAHFAKGMHGECKACMDACLECEKACRKIA